MITEPDEKISSANSSALIPAIGESQSSSSLSRGVVVGLLRNRVSEIIPDIIMPAIAGVGLSERMRNRSAIIEQVEPTGRLMNRMGCSVGMLPRRWWSKISVICT